MQNIDQRSGIINVSALDFIFCRSTARTITGIVNKIRKKIATSRPNIRFLLEGPLGRSGRTSNQQKPSKSTEHDPNVTDRSIVTSVSVLPCKVGKLR